MKYYQDMMQPENIYEPEHKREEKYPIEKVKEYIYSVVSGTIMPIDSEHGYMYVSFEKLKELVDEGYNIISVLNMDDLSAYKIHIEYQKYKKIDTNRHGR